MNILTDILSLIQRGKFATVAGKDDVVVLGMWNEKPEMTGVASPIPYKSVKLIKIKDLASSENCEYINVPASAAAGTVGVFQKEALDAATGKCTVSFRSLKSMSTNLTLALSSDDDYIEITTEGEPNTGANVGSGLGIFRDKVGETLNFKKLKAGNKITISGATDNELTITASNTTYTYASAVSGSNVDLKLTGSDASLSNVKLVAGTNITLTDNGSSEVTIASSGGGGAMSTFLIGGDSGSFQNVYDGNSVDISGGFAIDTIGTSPTTVSVSWNKTQALGYAHYVSNLSQANANAPTEVVLENNTTRTLTWSYVGAGQYRAVFSTALVDIDKVTFDISPHFKSGPSGVDIVASSVTGFTVQTFVPSTGTVTDSILSNTTLTFKIYP